MEDYIVKVPIKVTPIPHTRRKIVELVIGNDYYISFGRNKARKCKLLEIDKKENLLDMVLIEIYHNPKTKKRGPFGTHKVYADEIGLTPEGAVKHEVTL